MIGIDVDIVKLRDLKHEKMHRGLRKKEWNYLKIYFMPYYTTKTNSNVDSHDWKNLSADDITERVTKNISPGYIIQFHNAAKNTPAALPKIIEKIHADGYKIVPVSQIIMRENFVIDHTGKQIKKSEN